MREMKKWFRAVVETLRRQPTRDDPLKRLLAREIKSATDGTLSAGDVPLSKVERLSRLARLVELCEAASRDHKRRYWPIVASIVITLTVISVLLFVRVPQAQIELQLAVTDASFQLRTADSVAENVVVSEIGVSGLADVNFRGRSYPAAALRLSVPTRDVGGTSIALIDVTPPAGSIVRLSKTFVPQQFRIVLESVAENGIPKDINIEIRVVITGSLDASILPSLEEPLLVETTFAPEEMILTTGAKRIQIDLTPANGTAQLTSASLDIGNLAFERTYELGGRPRRTSSVIDGSLVIEDLDRKRYPVGEGDGVQVEAVGRISRPNLRQERLDVRFNGRTRLLSIGAPDNALDRMPRLVEWLSASYPVPFIWGLAGYVLVVLRFVLGGWRRMEM